VVLTSLATPDLRETAKGAIQYRRLIGFFSAIRGLDHRKLLLAECSWDSLLKSAGIAEIRTSEIEDPYGRQDIYIVLADGTFYRSRYTQRAFEEFQNDWNGFSQLEAHSREAIVDALLEDREARRFHMLQYFAKNIDDFLTERRTREQADPAEETDVERAFQQAVVLASKLTAS